MTDTNDDHRYYGTAEIKAGNASGLSKADVEDVKRQLEEAEKK